MLYILVDQVIFPRHIAGGNWTVTYLIITDIFPAGGNIVGGKMLGNHNHDDDDEEGGAVQIRHMVTYSHPIS